MFKILLLIFNILNIKPEKDLNAPPLLLTPFLLQPLPQSSLSPMTSAAISDNGGNRGSGGGKQQSTKRWQR
jgi:hypothetical protein